MATFNPPVTHGQTESTTGYSFRFMEQEIMFELAESIDPISAGLVLGVGDLAGSGSDTLRDVRFSNVGWDEQMQEMATETGPIPETGWDADYTSLTIGRYGLSKSDSYASKILARPQDLDPISQMGVLAARSALRTIRVITCEAASGFSSGVGTTGQVLTVDDWLELVALFKETVGWGGVTQKPIGLIAPEQGTNLRNSLRNEPAMASSAAEFLRTQSLTLGSAAQDLMGIDVVESSDVVTSSGDRVGGAYVPGALGLVVASTRSVQSAVPSMAFYIEQLGLIGEMSTNGNIASRRVDVNAWFGVTARSSTIFPQFKITSVNH